MLVFVFLWAPRLAKVCQNSWAVNDSNVQSSISKIRTTIDFCTIDVAVLTMLPSWSWLENSRRRVGHVSDFKCNGYDVLPWYSNYIPTFVEVPQQLLFQQTKFCTFIWEIISTRLASLHPTLPMGTTPAQHNRGSLWENHDLKSQDCERIWPQTS